MNMETLINQLVARRNERRQWANTLIRMINSYNTDIKNEKIASQNYRYELYAVHSELMFLEGLMEKLGVRL